MNDETYIKILKTYFSNKKNKSFEDKKEAGMAITDMLFYRDDLKDFEGYWGKSGKGSHAKDIFFSFERKSDETKIKNMLVNYGFILQETKRGFWITGVKNEV
nr:MAG TPA: hypothetical protein [Caudoviricetes sp.]